MLQSIKEVFIEMGDEGREAMDVDIGEPDHLHNDTCDTSDPVDFGVQKICTDHEETHGTTGKI